MKIVLLEAALNQPENNVDEQARRLQEHRNESKNHNNNVAVITKIRKIVIEPRRVQIATLSMRE